MTTYTVHFYTDADWASDAIEAATPAEALERARQIADTDDFWRLDFQSYDGTAGVEHIEVFREDGHSVAAWRRADLLVRLAANDLLDALEVQTDAAQAVLDAWATGDLAGAVRTLDNAISAARAAIIKANGGAS